MRESSNFLTLYTSESLSDETHKNTSYAQRFKKHSYQIPVGCPLMLMDQPSSTKVSYGDEASELLEVLEILKPQQNQYLNRSYSIFSTNITSLDEFNQEESAPLLMKKIKNDSSQGACCACPKSKCLKLYCICLQKSNYCSSMCSCKDCYNDVWHEQERQIVMKSEKFKNLFEGCHCKRSKCQQKYCECKNSGKLCGKSCKCKGCKNHDNTRNYQNQNAQNDQINNFYKIKDLNQSKCRVAKTLNI